MLSSMAANIKMQKNIVIERCFFVAMIGGNKMRKMTKRFMTALLVMVMLITNMIPMTVFAMDVSRAEVSWDYVLTDAQGNEFTAAYGLQASDNPYGYAINPKFRKMHDYTAKRIGLSGNKSDWNYGQDYVYCFCIEHGVALPDKESYSGSADVTHGNKYEMLSENQKNLVNLALSYGYPNRTDMYSSDDANACYSATQLIIWQITLGFRTSPTELNDKTYPMSGYSGTMTEQYTSNQYLRHFYNLILSDMASHYTRPSFTSNVPVSAQTYEMNYANGQYSVTLTDTNNVLSNYYVSADGGASVTINGNQLIVTSSNPINDSVTIKLNRRMPSTNLTTGFLIWSVAGREDDNQDMISGVPADNDPVPSYLKVKTAAGSLKIVKTSEDGKVDGVKFQIIGNGVNQIVVTKNGGQMQVDNLRPGVYSVTEQTEERYETQETKKVTVISGKTATVTFHNVLKRGNLKVTKTSEDKLNQGVKFHLYGTSLSGQKVDKYAVTNATGIAEFKDVLIGTDYTLEEVDTAIRYVVPKNQTAAIEWNKVTNKSVTNILKKFNVTVTKTDKETKTAQGDADLSGAEYGIYKGGQLIDVYTTDKNGKFTTKYYECGDDWTIQEIKASEGYLLDSMVYSIGAEAKLYTVEYNKVNLGVTEIVKKGKIAIIKHTDNGETKIETPESGAEFEVFLKAAGSYDKAKESERDYLVCDENGFAETKELPYGVYTVVQKKGWAGRELMEAFDVFIQKDEETYRYLINNANFESYLKVVKTDAETGKTIPYAGAGFQIYRPDGSKVEMTYTYPEVTTIDTFYTTEKGELVTPQKLEYGKGYFLVEVFAPYGYVLDSNPVYFDINQENSSKENGVTIVKVDRPNMAQKGTITITKAGEVFSSVAVASGTTLDSEGNKTFLPVIYQPIYENSSLKDAVYEVSAAEDIRTPDGTLRYEKGQVVGTLTTDENGSATTGELYLGKYHVKEVKAPYGMVLNNEVHTVELCYAGQEVSLTQSQTSFYNERQKVAISLEKVMENDELFGIGTNEEILNVSFGLYASESLVAADGMEIPKDGLIEIVSCDACGIAEFKSDVPVGAKLYVKEYSTDNHYMISEKMYPVVFDYEGQETAVVNVAVNSGEAVTNDLIRGSIAGKKVDEDGVTIEGAVFGLFHENETEFVTDTAILISKSNENGIFGFSDVPYGNWIVRELQPATGFVLNETAYPVTISEHEQLIEIEFENRFIRGTVQTTKVDAQYPENKLTGAVFEIYVDADGNKKFDADIDMLVGELTEVDEGIYHMENLRYNGYFLHEKTAPEGFLLDEGYYYFSITKDGETVVVENKAGIGFINQPITGEIEITKKDVSDGVLLPNAGFRIRNEAGEIVAEGYTDENGIAKFTLRYGKYTYEEFDAPEGYLIDTTPYAFEIKENGQIIKAEMTNEKVPEPEAPKTGDNSMTGFWIGLGAVALGGLISLGIIRKKNGGDDE